MYDTKMCARVIAPIPRERPAALKEPHVETQSPFEAIVVAAPTNVMSREKTWVGRLADTSFMRMG